MDIRYHSPGSVQKLRRPELQNLAKQIGGIKANAKNELLIQHINAHFSSFSNEQSASEEEEQEDEESDNEPVVHKENVKEEIPVEEIAPVSAQPVAKSAPLSGLITSVFTTIRSLFVSPASTSVDKESKKLDNVAQTPSNRVENTTTSAGLTYSPNSVLKPEKSLYPQLPAVPTLECHKSPAISKYLAMNVNTPVQLAAPVGNTPRKQWRQSLPMKSVAANSSPAVLNESIISPMVVDNNKTPRRKWQSTGAFSIATNPDVESFDMDHASPARSVHSNSGVMSESTRMALDLINKKNQPGNLPKSTSEKIQELNIRRERLEQFKASKMKTSTATRVADQKALISEIRVKSVQNKRTKI